MSKKIWSVITLVAVISIILIYQSIGAGQVLANQGLPGSGTDPLVSKGYIDTYLMTSLVPLQQQLADTEKRLREIEGKVTTVADRQIPYPDIKGHWAQRDITFLASKKIVTGFEDDTFRPSGRVTRVQLAVMLVRAKGLPLEETVNDFKDVTANFWASKEIAAAKKAGIISGYPDGTFKPANQVTRQEIVTMIARAFPLDGTGGVFFGDTKNSWAKDDIAKLAGVGIIGGYEDDTFRPTRTATRAEISAILARTIDSSRRLQR
ncbi:MAG: S-layer homology domain-containing protein [Clostridia bacterium]|nr:S-layer homology domain-containing protein [Clostridia bacterium]